MRHAAAFLTLCLALGACGSGGINPIVKDSFQRLNPFGGSTEAAGDAPARPPTRLTRAAVERSGVAMIRASLLSEEGKFLFAGVALNDGRVTFSTQAQQQITLQGTRITGTRGLGYDLLAHQTEGRDPLVTPTPPDSWPTRITRVYTLPGGDSPEGRQLVFDCTITREGPASLTIVERAHRGIQFSETCKGTGPETGQEIENLYLADARTGFVWRSIQWIGPRMGNVDLEIIEPYTGR